jgi:hypothetical protein
MPSQVNGPYLLVPQNIGPPATITVRFLGPVFAGDLTQVSGISASLLRKDGSTTTLAFAIVAATPQQITAQYTFANAGEITSTGAYLLACTLAVPGGNLPAETITLFVASTYQNNPVLETSAWLAATSIIPQSPAAVAIPWVYVSASSSPYFSTPLLPYIAFDGANGPGTIDIWTPSQDSQFIVISDFKNLGSSSAPITLVASGTNTGTSTPWLLWDPSNPGSYTGTAHIADPSGQPVRLRASFARGLWLPW